MSAMRSPARISVIIPALNEEASILRVLADIPANLVHEVIVVDNGSTDATADRARDAGVRVIHEPRRGYGSACLAGIAALDTPDIVVCLDGDYSDYPDEMPLLIEPILQDRADIVIGSRTLGQHEKGALLPQARFGNWLATRLLRFIYGVCYTDLGPFRAIRYDKLIQIKMCDTNFGWTVEMQIKAARYSLRYGEVPVRYRKRIGVSKVTGTISGTFWAGYKILYTIFRYSLAKR